MNNIYYDDFKLIDEQKMNELACEYNKKLNSVKINQVDNEFREKFDNLMNNLLLSLHYVRNLIMQSKNNENFSKLKQIEAKLLNFEESLKILYEIDKSQNNEEIEQTYSNNKQGLIESLLQLLRSLIDFENFEYNAKIKTSLQVFINDVIQILKDINFLNLETKKIFSLFFNRFKK